MRRRILPVALVALIFALFLASTPEAQVRIKRGFRAAITFVVNGIGTTTTAGVTLLNEAAAAAGAQQYSPAMCWDSYGWGTGDNGGSKSVEVCLEMRPVQAATSPTGNFVLAGRVDKGSWVNLLQTSVTAGNLNITGDVISSAVEANAGQPMRFGSTRGRLLSAGDGVISMENAAQSIGVKFQFAAVPSITTNGITGDGFGGGASILTGSTDTFGFIRVGAATEGVIAFATDWGTNLQQGCTANNEDGTPTYAQVTDKTMRLAGGTRAAPVAWTSSSVVNWICGGAK